MKKLTSLLLVVMVAALSICAVGCEKTEDTSTYRVAMITDYGDITDQSFNQTTYEACVAFAEDNGIDFKYYKPSGDSTAERVEMIESAIDDGYNVLVMPGYAFAGAIVETCENNPDVKYIALDVALGDLLENAVGETYDYNPDNWNIADYYNTDNTFCAVYQEELSGYLAGQAAVKLAEEVGIRTSVSCKLKNKIASLSCCFLIPIIRYLQLRSQPNKSYRFGKKAVPLT